jgi:hypothetical protein
MNPDRAEALFALALAKPPRCAGRGDVIQRFHWNQSKSEMRSSA